MSYIEFDKSKPLDVIPIGRIAIDFNPTDMNMPLSQSSNFNKYVGGSPANIAVGLARLGAKCGFIARVSDDQFGDYVENYFKNDGIDVSHVFRCENGENLGLTFTEILSPTQSSILMYRDGVADLQVGEAIVDLVRQLGPNSKYREFQENGSGRLDYLKFLRHMDRIVTKLDNVREQIASEAARRSATGGWAAERGEGRPSVAPHRNGTAWQWARARCTRGMYGNGARG